MNYTEAKEHLHQHGTELLQRDRAGTGYICPICNSGAGKNGTGIQTKDGIHFSCFGGEHCYTSSDIIDIIGQKYNIPLDDTHFVERLKATCNEYGITLDEGEKKQMKPIKEKQTKAEQKQTDEAEQIRERNRAYIIACNKAVNKTDYWSKRGITEQTIARFNLGYDEKLRTVVIPIDEYTYKSRKVDKKEFYNSKGAKICLYNEDAIDRFGYIYICESEIDALSIEEAGQPAIALRGISNAKLIKPLAERRGTDKVFILALDNDEAGNKATAEVEAILDELGITHYDFRPIFRGLKNADGEPIKDINEALVNYREDILTVLNADIETITQSIEYTLQAEYRVKHSATAFIEEFINGVNESVNTPPIKTGFVNLDNYTGGLYEGLYTIGAISSLGKTTFIQQIADTIASSGRDVLYFSLEMSKAELMAKSFSRLTYEYCVKNSLNINKFAKSNIAITDGARYKDYDLEEQEIIKNAMRQYKEFSDHIFIEENTGNTSVIDIERAVAEHKKRTGQAPVIIVDYLQLLAPPQERLTDKQAVDITTVRLKKISRDYKIPVICISSFNRENYNAKVNYASFKESGNIEYTSNVIIGLQLKGVGEKNFNVDAEKQKNPRNIELVVLKNRFGKTGGTLYFEYYPQFNYFRAIGDGNI